MFWSTVEENLTSQAIELLFAAADIDANGRIGYQEFAAMLSFIADG
jgi:Ca2+-binding EF-hand superfamily protein